MARVIEYGGSNGTDTGVMRTPITKAFLIAGGILLVTRGYVFRFSGRVASLILGVLLVSAGGVMLTQRWIRQRGSAVNYVTLLLRESLPEGYLIARRFPLRDESAPQIEWLVLGPGGVYMVEQREGEETFDELRGRLRRKRRRMRAVLDEAEDLSVDIEILGVDRGRSRGQGDWCVPPGELVERIRSTEPLSPDEVQELCRELGLGSTR